MLPITIVIGSIGYYFETKYRKPQSIPYLEQSIADSRLDRQIAFEQSQKSSDKFDYSLREEKKRIVPKSSLELNASH
jgi:hypothetical protein